MQSFWKFKYEKYFLFFLIFFSLLMFTIEHINGRFWLNDLKVMHSAANAYLHNQPIYNKAFGLGSGFYKYSPITLLFFIPYAIVPFTWAANIHFFVIVLVAFFTIRTLNKLLEPTLPPKNQLLLFGCVFTTIVVHLTRELHLGNVNIILIYLLLQALLFWKQNKLFSGSMLMAIVVLTKPYLIILALPFLFRLRWKEVIYSSIGVLFLSFIGSLIIGFSKTIQLFQAWFTAISDHSAEMKSDQTIFIMLNKLLGIQFSSSLTIGGIVLVAGAITYLVQRKMHKTQITKYTHVFLLPIFLILALIPNFLITDTEHFLLSLPLIYWIYTRFSEFKLFTKIILVLGLALYAFHPALSFGTLGIGNLVLVATVIFNVLNRDLYSKTEVVQ